MAEHSHRLFDARLASLAGLRSAAPPIAAPAEDLSVAPY